MSFLKQLRDELKAKGKIESRGRGTTQLLQGAYVKDHPNCEKCGRNQNLTYDHIIPKSILTNFNIDGTSQFWEENSRTLCFACNTLKANNLDLTTPKTKELLLELIKSL